VSLTPIDQSSAASISWRDKYIFE